jgi:hypothetical protein
MKNFATFYEIGRFITEPTTARHLFLYEPYQFSLYSFHFLEIYFNIVLPSTSSSSKCSLYFSFPHQTRTAPLPICAACIIHLLILDTAYETNFNIIPRPRSSNQKCLKFLKGVYLNLPENDYKLCKFSVI